MSMKQIGTAVLNPGTSDETWGICESAEVSPEAEKKEINNGEGDTVGLPARSRRWRDRPARRLPTMI